MMNTSPRQFDLYDFFSVLLPGVSFLLGVFPFFPNSSPISSLGAIVPVVVGGFVIGRAIHAAAVRIDDFFEHTSHRERFRNELQDPSVLPTSTVDHFYDECKAEFKDTGLPQGRGELDGDDHKRTGESLYGLVRSYIHIDARGRSRTFQAVYAFYRSMWLTSVLVYVFYLGYSVFTLFEVRIVTYVSFIGVIGISANVVFLTSTTVLLGSFLTFRYAKTAYQIHFIQYLISDFIVLRRNETPEMDESPPL